MVKIPTFETLKLYVDEHAEVAPTTKAEAVSQGLAVALGVTVKLSEPSVIVIAPAQPET